MKERLHFAGLARRIPAKCNSAPHTIPQRSDQRARRAGRPGRPLAFDRERYRGRNVVERCFNRLKQFRAVATRFEKRAVNYRAMVVIASLLIWLEG
jgi:transposase